MQVIEVEGNVERRHLLSVVPEATPTDDRRQQIGRRWDDRPGELATMTFAHFLTARPSPDEAVRLLVALLCWPIGAQGALVVKRTEAGLRTVAKYVEQVQAWPEDLAAADVPSEVQEIVRAAVGAHPVLWSHPDGPVRPPMAAWILGAPSDPAGVLVVFLSTSLEQRLVAMRANSVAEILGIYLAGNDFDSPRTSGRPSSSKLGAEALSARQLRILQMMADELTNPQIASRIGFSTSTVRMESLAIYRALGVHDRQHAVIAARALNLLQPE
jgi:DNA-binding CsgD family transcriptional regulator